MDATPDALTVEQARDMSQTFEEFEIEYREDDGNTEVVYEDDDVVIVADHTGHELREWASQFDDVSRRDLLEAFRAVADDKMDADDAHEWFSHSDPVVFEVEA